MSIRWRWIVIAGLVLAVSLPLSRPARADNGPHGNYTPTTDACAGCHRAHTAVGSDLVVAASSTALCLTCHGTSGTGADTDVINGVYLQRDDLDESPPEGVVNRGLKAGGFGYARMDTTWTGDASPRAVTSSHLMDGSTGIVWGSGAINSGPGEAIALACTSCHDPHGGAGGGGSATYRILRPTP
ncbi:MAG: cytochrome c3 family protein, partial [Chloroflexi bacterium]|nr:cytochrome c3 family protein [Chloroflexota bacterium]